MKLIVPTNWEGDLLDSLRLDSVAEFYGKANSDSVGGGRGSLVIPDPSRADIERQIKRIVQKGIGFNYLLNATCLEGKEHSSSGQEDIRALMEWLLKCGVTGVTVARPQLLWFIKKEYPSVRVSVSTQAGIRDRQAACAWEDLGADALTLSFVDVNRDFSALRGIRKAVSCDLQLIANLDCLRGCPYFRYHAHITSHASQRRHPSGGFYVDYCFLKCNFIKLRDPAEFMRSGWIRPEDMPHYADAGINALKLVNRTMSTGRLKMIVEAYTSGAYTGNLFDLFSEPARNITVKHMFNPGKLRLFLRPESVNIFRLAAFRSIAAPRELYIDNRSLDGFITRFLESDCGLKDCEKCGYCSSWAGKVIRESPGYRQKAVNDFQRCLDVLIGGGLFTYR
jgi:collagenase-like PrtC family protease